MNGRAYDFMAYYDQATVLVESDNIFDLRLASLLARMAIEDVVYREVSQHKNLLPKSFFKNWQPKKLFDRLTHIDNYAFKGGKIVIYKDKLSDNPDQEELFSFDLNTLEIKPLVKTYQSLGSFLHQHTLDKKPPSCDVIKEKVKCALEQVKPWYDNPVWAKKPFGAEVLEMDCPDGCGHLIKKYKLPILMDGYLDCEGCGYRAFAVEYGDVVRYKKREKIVEISCPSCGDCMTTDIHKLIEWGRIECDNCGVLHKVWIGIAFKEFDSGAKLNKFEV